MEYFQFEKDYERASGDAEPGVPHASPEAYAGDGGTIGLEVHEPPAPRTAVGVAQRQDPPPGWPAPSPVSCLAQLIN